MNKFRFLLVYFTFASLYSNQSAITYLDNGEWGGRLGDKLIMYTKAKWVAFHYNLSFYYKSFPYSDQFMMHVIDNHMTSTIKKTFSKNITYKNINGVLNSFISPEDNTLYTIHYDFHLPHWGNHPKKYDSQEIMMWPEIYNNNEFIKYLKKAIAPRSTINIFVPPTDLISVAVHIRKGGGIDKPLLSKQIYNIQTLNPNEAIPEGIYCDRYQDLKFLPTQYYIDQIIHLSNTLNNVPLYIYIFTDDQNPIELMNIIKNNVDKKNITFACRTTNNGPRNNVLEDMFSIANFDCLIRSGSNYPQISQLIGNHSIVIYPQSAIWIGTALVADNVGTFIKKDASL